MLKQGSLTITDFFTNLKATWEELDNFHPLTPCNCQARLYHEQDFIIHFLKGSVFGEEAGCFGVFLFVHVGWDIACREWQSERKRHQK